MERRPENIRSELRDHSMPPLPPSQRAEMWDVTEDDFWRRNAIERHDQFSQHSQRWNRDRSSIIAHIRGAKAEIRELGEQEGKLSRELAAIRSRTALVNETYSQEAQRLNSIDTQHSVEKQGLVKKHERIEAQMNDWFRRCRNQDGVNERRLALPELIDRRPPERQLKLPPLANLHLPREMPKNDDRMVAIIDSAVQRATVKAYSSHCSPPQVQMSGFKAVNQAVKYEPASPVPSAVPSLTASSSTSYPRSPKASASECSIPRPRAKIFFGPMDAAPSSNDITKETLILRHDGTFYTYPECIAGVPLEKITPSHPYWETKWPELQTLTEPILRSWEEKFQSVEAASRVQNGGGSVKYQYGTPTKKYVSVGKGSITSYDTLFRLCETIEALANYKTDVGPVDWMRQRLHELITAQGSDFNFSKTIHGFYNDPKLAALRQKSGFKTIGRPPGVNVPSTSSQRKRKRKSPPSYGTPSPRAKPPSAKPLTANPFDADQDPEGKKQQAVTKVLDSLKTGEVSDADSVSGATISGFDFRIYQIKTRLFTSSEKATQYWRWVPENSMFEHQVPHDRNSAGWSMHREPVDFSVRLEDVVKISWNLKALRVYLVMSDRHICFEDNKPRGDVMVAFKRWNTMKRFMQFCRRKEIELVEGTWKKMEHLWGTMHPQ
ncbi:hypothetical protein ISF_09383 [Cordyceps fumosorosea ARSEF 2679]|uniref:Uncharacterized protein n=1 Tax=Cordyceps fumosorosea (strain ARSEF 2679) TaxID=1081104 RepID=A0A167JH25_CORFA|nr:hypothetical protein ISF_09383 [Cordyceps fumosorosea ARSEF 2679]OAA50253.1 hypothetical protein ISF_09383 [Cordyceps fumosorosea ARSEF 2679]